jgi:predicted HAD superfamily Cof-like phosphohydrolase
MKQAASAVIEFNRDLLGTLPRPVCPMETDEYLHLGKAIREEMQELAEAWANEDVVGMVDAKIDAIYFLIGGLYKNGLTAEQIGDCFMAVHNANMLKVKGRVAARATGDVPDALKPEAWVDPKIAITAILGLSV